MPRRRHGGFLAPVAGRASYVGGIATVETRRKLKTGDFLPF